YAISVPQNSQTSSEIHRMAAAFGMPSYHVDGTWYETMYQLLPNLINRMRQGTGPVLIEAQVVRLESHSSSDDQMKYRSEEEMARARERDPILLTERYLTRHGIMWENEFQDLRSSLQPEINQAADEADAVPQPETGHITERI